MKTKETLRAEDICEDCGMLFGEQEISSADCNIQCDGAMHWNYVIDSKGRHLGFQCRSCAANWRS